MMVANGVTIFFHGHDHQFAREELDGLVYVGLPHPAKARYDDGFGYYNEDEVHVNGGETTYVANNSGYIRVEVDSDQISYAYVRNFLRTTCRDGACNHDVQYEETISAPEGTNTKPVANPDQVTVVRNSGDNGIDVLANDEDADMDVLTIIGANQPLHGAVTPVETEATTLIYTPNADYCNSEADPAEPDTFSYVISDGNGRTATATVQVTVQCETPVDTDADAGTGEGGSQ
jgi:hypothetical protein